MDKQLIDVRGAELADAWLLVDDEAEIPETGKLLLSLERLQADGAQLLTDARELGVILPNTMDVQDLAAVIAGCSLVVLQFPAFADGRAYSQARLLRERLNFVGEIRARGDVQFDQLFYMARCGFDSFDVPAATAPKAAAAFRAFSVAYQPTTSGPALQTVL